MYFDTHCHLNFKAFDGQVGKVIDEAKKAGVNNIIVPGTNVLTSQKAVEIAEKYDGVFAAVGIHPHHVYQYKKVENLSLRAEAKQSRKEIATLPSVARDDINEIEKLLLHPKVVAVGEIGMDKHYYQKTKYKNYQIDPELVEGQKDLFIEQIKLAHRYKKALIIHNREAHLRQGFGGQAKKDVLEILTNHQSLITSHSSVFHCCEPDGELLDFAKKNNIFIGVDGDITYRKDKQEFIKKVPLDLLVLETDSPFLTPKLVIRRSSYNYLNNYNEPKNIPLIAEFIAELLHCSIDSLAKQTTENAKRLFQI